MKIAYFTHFFPPAGFAAATNTYEIVKALAMKGHEVHVFGQPTFSKYTASDSARIERNWPEKLKVHFSIQTPLPLTVTIPHMVNVLESIGTKYDFDVIVTQFHPFHLASLSGYLRRILARKPWVIKAHDIIVDPSSPMPFLEKNFVGLWYGLFMSKLGRKADKFFVLTSELKRFLEFNGFSPERVMVIPNGVDTRLFSPSDSRNAHDSGRMMLYTGSMTWDDGLDRLIKAFDLLDHSSDVTLTLIGDGPERSSLIRLARKLGLEKRIVFHRYVSHDEIPDFVRKAYLTIGPLRPTPIIHYTIPTKILEYFACGKPVVTCKVSSDILLPGETGLVVEKSDPESISESLTTLLTNEKLTARIGNNARLLIKEKYDWSRVIDAFEKEIETI